MRGKGNIVWLVAAAVACFAASGCGGPSAKERAQSRRTDGALLLAEVRTRADQRAEAERAAAHQECREEIGDFLEALDELSSRLDVGLNF
jgi:hypothetical protein